MILVADSGSTKCDWILMDAGGEMKKTSTMGFNPFFHTANIVTNALSENEELSAVKEQVTQIFFYGAGCSHEERNLIISGALRSFFPNVTTCTVDHDLTGAALATCGNKEGIACIIGTGSNSCYFDGSVVHEVVPALGYILGDEGSGSFFGKIMLSDFLYGRMPVDLIDEFRETYGLTKEIIFTHVYNRPNANVYLASFMKFSSSHKDHPYFKQMIYTGLARFAATHVWCFENFREIPVHFVGSIAYYFREVLEEVAFNHKFTVGNVVKKPVIALAEFHYNQLFKEDESQSVHL